MMSAQFQFYGELNFFLPPHRRAVKFYHCYPQSASIKDMIESLGVPHPEIEAIIVNGRGVDFHYLVQNGDRIGVYPISATPPQSLALRPPLPHAYRFLLDVHLGKLATSLRMLGFDCLYRNNYDDPELAATSHAANRILLTRDRGLLKRKIVTYGYYIRATKPKQQLVEVIRRFALLGKIKPLQRCLKCNGELRAVDKHQVIEQLPTHTRQHIDQFYRCSNCQQVYWRGSHYQAIQEFIGEIVTASRAN